MHIFVVLLRREFKTASNGVQKMYKLHLKETRILRSRKRFHLEKFCQSSETSLQEHSEFFFKHFFGYIFFFCIFPFDVQFGRYFRRSIMVEFDSSYIDVHEKRFDYFVTFYLQNIIVNSDGRLQSRFFRRQSTTKVVAHFMQRGCLVWNSFFYQILLHFESTSKSQRFGSFFLLQSISIVSSFVLKNNVLLIRFVVSERRKKRREKK